MPLKKTLVAAVLAVTTAASALPALPTANVITTAVQQALNVSRPAVDVQLAVQTPVSTAPVPTATSPASPVAQTLAVSRSTGRSVIARATAYNSLGSQTDSTPHITATGTRTRLGVVALSRDLLRVFPYGTRVQIQDLSGGYNFGNQVFIVEDTMNVRKVNSIDVWLPSYSQALRFGARQVRVTALN